MSFEEKPKGLEAIRQFDVLANWTITKFCNFRCEYCFSYVRNQPNPPRYSVEAVARTLDSTKLRWLLHISGGEPFCKPDFVSFCSELTKNHYISLNTNLSTHNVLRFAESIDPDRVSFLHCALHIEERMRLDLIDDFIEKHHYLRDQGFNTFVTQVMYPPLERYADSFEVPQKRGIVIIPKIFMGLKGFTHYPGGYTSKERKTILNYYANSENSLSPGLSYQDPRQDKRFLRGELSFKGVPCNAGKDFVKITEDGYIFRCQGSKARLGNVYQGDIRLKNKAEACPSKICPCPYYGLGYTKGAYRIVNRDTIMDKGNLVVKEVAGRILNRLPHHPLTFSMVKRLKRWVI
jgi:MoaA/NifB/PqqE/SkfB family radical SAM enzyme